MPRFLATGPRLFGKTSPQDRLAALWDVSAVDQHMRWVTRIAAPILLADVGDHRFGVFSLDLKSSDERVSGADGDVVRLPLHFKPDGKLHERASSTNIWARRSSMSSPCMRSQRITTAVKKPPRSNAAHGE